MTWDETKQTLNDRPDIVSERKLTSADWNDMVADQKDHATRHEDGGVDELSVQGLSGLLADPQTPDTEDVQDIVGAFTEAATGSNISVDYDDANDTLTIDTTALNPEETRDTVNDLLVGGSNTTLTYDDGNDTLTIDVDAPTTAEFEDHSTRHESGGADEIGLNNLDLPAGAQIDEDGGDLVVRDSGGSIVLRRDETAGTWDFVSGDLTGIASLEAEKTHTEEVPVYDVTAFGADADGTDDSASIQSAIDAAVNNGGGEVFFPPGTYVLESRLDLDEADNIIISGSGYSSHLDFVGNIHGLRATDPGAHNITIRDLRIQGDPEETDKLNGVDIRSGENVVMENLFVHDWGGDAIKSEGVVKNTLMIGNTTWNNGDDGLDVGGVDGDVSHNRIIGNYTEEGIHISIDSRLTVASQNIVVDSYIDFYQGRKGIVSNNIVIDSPNFGIGIMDNSNVDNIVVEGNFVYNTANNGIEVVANCDGVVKGNLIVGGDSGIKTNSVPVIANTIIGASEVDDVSGDEIRGIDITNSKTEPVSISSNTIRGDWNESIWITGENRSITGNTVDTAINAYDDSDTDYNAYTGNVALGGLSAPNSNSTTVGNIDRS